MVQIYRAPPTSWARVGTSLFSSSIVGDVPTSGATVWSDVPTGGATVWSDVPNLAREGGGTRPIWTTHNHDPVFVIYPRICNKITAPHSVIRLVVSPKTYLIESLKVMISQVQPIWSKMCIKESLNLKLIWMANLSLSISNTKSLNHELNFPLPRLTKKHKLLIRSRWFFDLSLLKLNDKHVGEDVHAQGVGEVVDFALWFFFESVFSKFEGVLLRYRSRDFRFR